MTTWTDAIKAAREQMIKNCTHVQCKTMRVQEDYAWFDVTVCGFCDEIVKEEMIDPSKDYLDVD